MASDLQNIGKRMPYSVPKTFFPDLESRIMAETVERTHLRWQWLRPSLVAAASLAIIVLGAVFYFSIDRVVTLPDVSEAFYELSPDDQSAIIDNYNDDIFFSQY